MPTATTAYTTRTHAAKRELIREYKVLHGCPCGESRPECLDLHHRDPSTKHPAMARGSARGRALFELSWAAIVEEIAKCDVWCANCHRMHHLSIQPPIERKRKRQPQELEARKALGLEGGE